MIFDFPGKNWACLLACLPLAVAAGPTCAFDDTLAAPTPAANGNRNPFEKQFAVDTGATNAPRTEIFRRLKLAVVPAKADIAFRFKLTNWPKASQSAAHLWVAIGATNALSTDGSLGLSFLQNGTGMSTDLNNAYNIDGTMVLGSDFAVTDGEVTVEVQNKTHLPAVNFSVCAIVYVPPSGSAKAMQ